MGEGPGLEGKFDDLLMGMAAQHGSLEPLLRTFFSFLHRKTDLYVVADFSRPEGASMGFPPGAAEKIVSLSWTGGRFVCCFRQRHAA